MVKYKNYSLFGFFMLTWNVNLLLCLSSSDTTFYHSISILESILLTCHCFTGNGTEWIHNDVLLNLKKLFLEQRLRDSAVLHQNYSLYLKSTSLSDDGIYSCMQGDNILARHVLTVQGL